ncbi:MAG: hypothetical protein GQ565_02885 [Candidatus Aegiribacteria sp.]|nr:hypothetical protein [Candidatus Aegiribacteria sp.]
MALFGKPRKIAVGKARDRSEATKVKRRLQKKYPQMYDKNGNLKEAYTGRKFSAAEKALRKAGISSDEMPTDVERRNRGK